MENHKISGSDEAKIFVVILVLILVGYLVFFRPSGQPNKPVISGKLPEGYHSQIIPKNKYPQGFPEKVIVKEGNPEWRGGEDTIVGSGKRLKIVELVYKKRDPATLAVSFEKTFKNEKWLLGGKQDKGSSAIRFFSKDLEEATLTIIKMNETDSLANITISTK